MDNWVYEIQEERNLRGDHRWSVFACIPMAIPPHHVATFDNREDAHDYVAENTWQRVDG